MAKDNKNPQAGLKKRQQIDHTSQVMFLWVAGASVIVAFAIVSGIFLIQKAVFVEKVLGKKNDTVKTLVANRATYKTLQENIKDLRGNRSIGGTPSSIEGGNNLDKIFDALPYEGDSVALGSSLQTALLGNISLENLVIDNAGEAAVDTTTTSVLSVDTSSLTPIGGSQSIGFSFKVTGSEAELKSLFERLDNSIRPIKIIGLQLEAASGDKIAATIQAVTYYQPYKTFELKEESIR